MADRVPLSAAFGSLRTRNFRLYIIGNTVSNLGEWAQRIGQAWLVLELSGSAVLLGVTAALQAAPMVLVGPWAGLVADRGNKLRLLLLTQLLAALLAGGLGLLTLIGAVDVPTVLLFAFALGCVKAFDHPTKQGLVVEVVGLQHLANAITLNNVAFNTAKSLGPALGGLLISTVGIAPSFFLNAATYAALATGLLLMRHEEIEFAPQVARGPGQLRAGLSYVVGTPILASTLVFMAVTGLLAFEWQVLLPILARDVFGGDAATFGLMFTAMGIGSMIGGLALAGILRADARVLLVSGVSFAGLFAAISAAGTVPVALVVLFLLGAASTALRSTGQAILLTHARPDMRGRVSALLSVAFFGTTVVGGPLVGLLTEIVGVRTTFVLVGSCVLLAALVTDRTLRAVLV